MADNYISFLENLAPELSGKIVKIGKGTGFFPGGENGPYFDLETPVRNSSHVAIIFSVLYYLTQKDEYKDTALLLLKYLKGNVKIQKNGVFIQRQKAGKDWCNGVIGQAWVIEAFSIASKCLDDTDCLNYSRHIAEAFPFDKRVKAWIAKDPIQGTSKVDYTLNHQLWYASALAETGEIIHLDHVELFLDHLLSQGFEIRNDGLIIHLLKANSFKGKILSLRYEMYLKRDRNLVIEKEIGYHLYNLFPLARLYRIFPDHNFFKSNKFIKALKYGFSASFLNRLVENKYAYTYNSPAFELPLVYEVFKHLLSNSIEKGVRESLEIQIQKTQNQTGYFLSDNNPDPLTLSSRAYELAIALI
ncbi:MAG TPA: hypothetical protein VK957_01870 [Lunatimonas sp.]|nr:hypothetical protein [Lunatimonas sp.]